jgi:putative MATE family efflux protein
MRTGMAPPAGGRLTTGSVRRQVISMTVPMIWGVLAVISKGIVDTFFVARLGTDELGAMSFAFPVMMVVSNLAIGLGVGTGSVVARAIGEGDPEVVRRRATDGLLLAVLVVSATSALGLLTLEPLFAAMGAEGEVMRHVGDYMRTWYWGMGFLVVPMVGNGIIRATGDAKVPGIVMTISAVVNIGLDPILIFGLLGAPALGIQGAALATVISNFVTFVAALAILHNRERMILWRPAAVDEVWQSWKAILHIGVPAAATNMVNPIGAAVVIGILAPFGTEVVAGLGVATRIEALAVVVLLALSSSVGPMVGQNAGAGRWDRVQETLRFSHAVCLVTGAAVAALMWAVGAQAVAIFDDSPQVLALATTYLRWVSLTYAGYGVAITTAAAFNALGRPLPSTTLVMVRIVLVLVPGTYLLSGRLGWSAVVWAAAAGNALAGAAALALARSVVARPRT